MLALIPPLDRFFRRRRGRLPARQDLELVRAVKEATSALHHQSDQQLSKRTEQLRDSVAAGKAPTSVDILVPAFALVYEAARRRLGITYYDVQLLGGMALARGAVAEMQTGEGKTFVAALPAFVRALSGRGVHVVTSNAYLAERDWQQMAAVYECLGMSVGLLRQQAPPHEKQAAYARDVTYGPGYEFGFDYLRDQVASRSTEEARLGEVLLGRLRETGPQPPPRVQRGLAAAIVDEVDHVLMDDASSPLIISEGSDETAVDAEAHRVARRMALQLEPARDYFCDKATGLVRLTRQGAAAAHADGTSVPWKTLLRPWSDYVEQALRVELLFRRDVHYVVQEGEVRVVDETTGRVFAQRSWRDGLHQAIQAREGVKVTSENRSLARITRQRLFLRYDQLCGMTGTATGSEREFAEFYGLQVVVIPLWKPCLRTMQATRYFADADAKWSAVVEEVRRVRDAGRPVLVGTRTIADSEAVAERLRTQGVPHELLNGKQDADEAAIVARAGERGVVTIATNMAGRGTDIKLAAGVAAAGGLHVIGTQRHSSHRIDRQLVGRSARQGDPGSARFFLSADDELIRTHLPWLERAMRRAAGPTGEIPVDYEFAVRKTQRIAEAIGYRRRRQLLCSDRRRDTVMAKFAGEEGE